MSLDPITRFVGPVPTDPNASTDYRPETGVAPEGPRPLWGGYSPVRYEGAHCPTFNGDLDLERERAVVAPHWGWGRNSGEWWAHSAPTPLRRDDDGFWWVGAPDRPSWRVVGLLREARRALPGARKDEISYALAHPSSRPSDPDLALWCAGVRGDAFAPERAGEDWYTETDAALDRWAYECGQAVAAGRRRPERPKTRMAYGRREVLVDDDLDIVRREDWPDGHLTTYSVRGVFGHDE